MGYNINDARKLFSINNDEKLSNTILDVEKELVKKVQEALPPEIRPILNWSNFCIAGGFIRDTINGTKPSDIDIWQIDSTLSKKHTDERFDSIYSFMKKRGYKIDYESKYAITFKHKRRRVEFPVQIMRRVYSNPNYIISDFDFNCCKFAVYCDKGDNTLINYTFHENAIEDTINKTLNYNNAATSSPSSILLHLSHLLKKGYNITNESLKLILEKYEKNVAAINPSTSKSKSNLDIQIIVDVAAKIDKEELYS